jgi:hypothetical protein
MVRIAATRQPPLPSGVRIGEPDEPGRAKQLEFHSGNSTWPQNSQFASSTRCEMPETGGPLMPRAGSGCSRFSSASVVMPSSASGM